MKKRLCLSKFLFFSVFIVFFQCSKKSSDPVPANQDSNPTTPPVLPSGLSFKQPAEGGDGIVRTNPTDINLLGTSTGEKVSSPENARNGMDASSTTNLNNLLGSGTGQLRISEFKKSTLGWKQSSSDTASIYYFSPERNGVYYRYNISTKKWNWGTWAINKTASIVAFNFDKFDDCAFVFNVQKVDSTRLDVKLIGDSNKDRKIDTSAVITFYAYDSTRLNKFPGTAKPVTGNTVTDVDGYTYPTVTIGTQEWMAENLRTTKYNNGTTIPKVTSDVDWYKVVYNNDTLPMMCWYNNDSAIAVGKKHGALYNFYVVKTGKICPTGWHVPTDNEWSTLEIYLAKNGYNFDGTSSTLDIRPTDRKFGKALASDSGWSLSTSLGAIGNTDYPNSRNKTGFSALPGGSRSGNGTFGGSGTVGYWWSATINTPFLNSWSRSLDYRVVDTDARTSGVIGSGFSVRCVKD